MPTYDYLCNQCGYKFEIFQAMSDEPLNTCPKCNGKVRRLVSGGTGLIFKGTGFYLTDYKNKPAVDKSGSTSKPSSKKPSSKNSKE